MSQSHTDTNKNSSIVNENELIYPQIKFIAELSTDSLQISNTPSKDENDDNNNNNNNKNNSNSSTHSFQQSKDCHQNNIMCKSLDVVGRKNNNHCIKSQESKIMPGKEREHFFHIKSLSQTIYSMIICIVCTTLSMEFSIRFPHYLSTAARMTFSHAWYQYDPSKTFFDTTILTYGTDYIIFILMVYASYQCTFVECHSSIVGISRNNTNSSATTTTTNANRSNGSVAMMDVDRSRRLRYRSGALLACYAISVLAGGYAHQFYVTFEDLQTTSFRILWTICVGSVTLAGGFMGMCGSEICRIFLHDLGCTTLKTKNPGDSEELTKYSSNTLWNVPIIPDSCWILYGMYMTLYCIAGGISCFRPAADIFLAGTTQFIPTFYCELIMLSRLWKDGDSFLWLPTIPKSTRYIFYYGFILNAPLLPLYPYLIHHTTLSLGAVNALLHLNLTISWGMQAISLYQICMVLNRYNVNSSQDPKLRVTAKTL